MASQSQRQPVTIQGQQSKIVYVQAPQQLGPNGQPLAPVLVYVQPVQSGQLMHLQHT